MELGVVKPFGNVWEVGRDCSGELAGVFFAKVWFKAMDRCAIGVFRGDLGMPKRACVYGRGGSSWSLLALAFVNLFEVLLP